MSIPRKTKDLNCLIVDDNKDIREILTDMLERLNMFKYIVHAENEIDAAIKIGNQRFDVVICDMQMPKKDGISFLADELSLRRSISANQVIVLSGNFDGPKVNEVLTLGIKKIMVKPISFDKLKLAVNDIIQGK
jgi:DNA-binding NarL/FixJ family response regulator